MEQLELAVRGALKEVSAAENFRRLSEEPYLSIFREVMLSAVGDDEEGIALVEEKLSSKQFREKLATDNASNSYRNPEVRHELLDEQMRKLETEVEDRDLVDLLRPLFGAVDEAFDVYDLYVAEVTELAQERGLKYAVSSGGRKEARMNAFPTAEEYRKARTESIKPLLANLETIADKLSENKFLGVDTGPLRIALEFSMRLVVIDTEYDIAETYGLDKADFSDEQPVN